MAYQLRQVEIGAIYSTEAKKVCYTTYQTYDTMFDT